MFKKLIVNQMRVASSTIEWAFPLAIFFLGMSAAFLGPVVEKDIRRSALISLICFVVGFAGTGGSIAVGWLPGVFICYGAIMGIGLGVGYLTPVKNLMLWFADNKGLATGHRGGWLRPRESHRKPRHDVAYLLRGPGEHVLYAGRSVCGMMFLGFLLIRRPAGYA